MQTDRTVSRRAFLVKGAGLAAGAVLLAPRALEALPRLRVTGFDLLPVRATERTVWLIVRVRTNAGLTLLYPVWSPDGTRIAYTIIGEGVFIADANKSSSEQSPESLPTPGEPNTRFEAFSWSSDERRIIGTLRRSGGVAGGIIAYTFASHSYEKLADIGFAPVC